MTFTNYRVRLTAALLSTALIAFSINPVSAAIVKETVSPSGKRIAYPGPKFWRNTPPTRDRAVHEKIKRVIASYKTGLGKTQKIRITQHILEQSNIYGYDPLFLTALIITESSFNPRAKSRVGALGLMQIRPRTGRALASETHMRWRGNDTLYHPEQNIALGSYYLDKLIHRFGNLKTALEAYNHGPTRISRYLKKGWHPIKYSGKVFSIYNNIRFVEPLPEMKLAKYALNQPAGSPQFNEDPAIPSVKMVTTFQGDSLWRMAKRLGFDSREATLVAVALWLDNQEAFINGNLHGIEADKTIRLDNLDYRMATLDKRNAHKIVQTQWKEWQGEERTNVPVRMASLESGDRFPSTESPVPVTTIPGEGLQLEKTHEPIFPGDTLGKISRRLGYSSRDATRVAVALWLDNMDAFIGANIHRIKAGGKLSLENLANRLKTLDRKTASRIVQNQWRKTADPKRGKTVKA